MESVYCNDLTKARNLQLMQIVDWPGETNSGGGYGFVQQIKNFTVQFFGGFESAIYTLR